MLKLAHEPLGVSPRFWMWPTEPDANAFRLMPTRGSHNPLRTSERDH